MAFDASEENVIFNSDFKLLEAPALNSKGPPVAVFCDYELEAFAVLLFDEFVPAAALLFAI